MGIIIDGNKKIKKYIYTFKMVDGSEEIKEIFQEVSS